MCSNAPDSSADIREAITDWYKRADNLLRLLLSLASQAEDRFVRSVVFCEPENGYSWDQNGEPVIPRTGGPSEREDTLQKVRRLFDDLTKAQQVVATQLRANAEHLLVELALMRSVEAEPLLSRLKLAYAELGDFCVPGFADGRWAWPTLQELSYRMRRWAVELASVWEAAIVQMSNHKLAQLYEQKRLDCPINAEIVNAIRQRLVLEESRLLRDLDAYPWGGFAGGKEIQSASERVPTLDAKSETLARLLGIFTVGLTDERLVQAAAIIEGNGTVNEKLTAINKLIPFPPTTSAGALGKMLRVKKQSVQQTPWWEKNRKGQGAELVDRRLDKFAERSQSVSMDLDSDADE